MILAVSFWTDFGDQQQWELLLIGVVGAAVYSALLVIPALAGGKADSVQPLLWSAVALQLFVFSLILYQAAALYYRPSPSESDGERQAEAFDEWQLRARLGFVALYLLALAVTAGGGYVLARRPGAFLASASVLAFMFVTSWFVEYTNVCEIGYGWADFPCT